MADFWKNFIEKRKISKQDKQLAAEKARKEKRRRLLKEGKLTPKGRIGLCLGGGGARGFAHIGAIKAMEEAGIGFDLCVGTSVGALIGSLVCGGMSADQMFAFGEALDMRSIRSGSLLFSKDTDGIQNVVRGLLGDVDIEDLKKQFTAVATDLVTGKEVLLDSGNLAKSVAASCCVPHVFKPVIMDDMHLVDGGLVNNIPADVCRVMGADYVITVDVNPSRGQGTDDLGMIAVLKATFSIMMSSASYKGYMNSDVIIKADTKDFSSTSKEGYDEMYKIGYDAMQESIDEIIEKLYW